MAKKTRAVQQQRARQEQWQRRVDAQVGGESTTSPASARLAEDAAADVALDAADGYQQAELRQMPADVALSPSAGARTVGRTTTTAARTTGTTGTSQRRAGTVAANRANRTRIAVNTMSLEEEMHYVRADIRKLTILTTACLAIIVVLAIILNNL